MLFSPQRLSISWLSACIALIGAAYCGIQVFPDYVESPCPGAGCALFRDFTVYGVSLWWAGVGYFAFVALLCLRRAQGFALATAGIALGIDALLCLLMLLTASCVACLGAAALMGLLFFVLRRHVYSKALNEPKPSPVFILWGCLFIAALAPVVAEQVKPWAIAGAENAEKRVYFAPSCPACRDAIAVFAGQAAFYPIAEKESDYAAIRAMQTALNNGKTMVEALEIGQNAASRSSFSLGDASFRFKLLRNKAEVLHLGFGQLPLIMINGMPQALRPNTAARHTQQAPSAALPPELLSLDSCGDNTPEPCDEPR